MTSTQLQNSPQVDDEAPDFIAASTSGSNVTLSALRGKRNVLLAFFPLAFTGTCTKELGCFTEDFVRTELLSDFKRDVSRPYGVLDEERFFEPGIPPYR